MPTKKPTRPRRPFVKVQGATQVCPAFIMGELRRVDGRWVLHDISIRTTQHLAFIGDMRWCRLAGPARGATPGEAVANAKRLLEETRALFGMPATPE